MFNEKEIYEIEAHGLTVEQVEGQIEAFRRGFPSLEVVEGNQALWLCAVVQPLLDDGRHDRLVVCEIYARSSQLLVESELFDILQ